MKKGILPILIICLICGQANALTQMGPPTATVEAGRYIIAPEFTYSENDIEACRGAPDRTLEMDSLLARLSYGYSQNVELSVRGGISGGDIWVPAAVGAGAKWTFYNDETYPLGVLCQAMYYPGDVFATDLEAYEVQIAVGTTYKYDEDITLYGGPFLHLLRGDEQNDIPNAGNDIEEESMFGAYLGVRTNISENLDLDVEVQVTGGGWGISVGLPWRF